MHHVVLLGDSVFDNRSYVQPGEPDVVRQLRERLDSGSRATLLAMDGDTVSAVQAQVRQLPADATHLFISVGGNDALGCATMLGELAEGSVGDALVRLDAVAWVFELAYAAMLDEVLSRGIPTALCTIYFPRFDLEDVSRAIERGVDDLEHEERNSLQRAAVAGLALFNDAIIRKAFEKGLPLLDLRLICSEESDYANPIEPSAHGGAKIAEQIVNLLRSHDFGRERTEVFR